MSSIRRRRSVMRSEGSPGAEGGRRARYPAKAAPPPVGPGSHRNLTVASAVWTTLYLDLLETDKWLSKRSNVRLVRLESLCVAWPTSSFRRIKRSLARTLRAARVQAPETTQSLVFRLHDGKLGRPGEAQFPVMQPEHQ